MNTTRPMITARKGIITSGHYLATNAGIKMYAQGGNAIDAAVAAGFALTVLKPHHNTLGGECPILIYSPKEKKVVSISGQGTAPKKATIKWFRENNIDTIPGDGLLGATVPGMFGAYCTALKTYGRLSLKEVLAPAIELAEDGFPVYRELIQLINENKEKFIEEWPTTAEIFLPGGKTPEEGDLLKQQALANTMKKVVEAEQKHLSEGREKAIEYAIDLFYKGELAESMVDFLKNNAFKDATGKKNSSLLEMEDFAGYKTKFADPVCADYKGYTVYKCGPWTQGPVFLQQLKLLEGFDLNRMGPNSYEYVHTVVECSKLAYRDREKYYGDPEFSDVPLERLLSDEYNNSIRQGISPHKANNEAFWNVAKAEGDKAFRGDTTQLDAIDEEGYMISATPSGAWIISSPIISGIGFPIGTRAQMFSLEEGHPNCLKPGKRPRTTLTPSIVFKDSLPWMAFGTPGGDMQDQWTLQFFLNVVEFNMNIQEAVEVPSFHSTHFPCSFYPRESGDGNIYVEKGLDYDVLCKLQEMGHRICLLPERQNGEVCAVCINQKTRIFEGAASNKMEGNAYVAGW